MQKRNKSKKNFLSFFEKRVINRISKSSGFCKRSRKIQAVDFVVGFLSMSLKGVNTYSCWVEEISLLCKKTISKQSLFERVGKSAVDFVRELLEEKLSKAYRKEKSNVLFSFFKNVFLHDSTTLHLADKLVNVFPGNVANGKQRAVARIQAIYNLKQNLFSCFKLTPYTKNDQGASPLILEYINAGDLIIRDLGFFVLDIFKRIVEKKAYFLSRIRYGVNLYDQATMEKIDLYKILKKKKNLDKQMLIGEDQRLEVRLVARKLPEHIAGERRRKAKKDRDKRLNHSKKYYYLLGFGIYITNVEKEIWTSDDVEKAYRVRWQIEIIFKSWKSHFNIQRLIHSKCQNRHRVECIIYLCLLFITLFQTQLYNYFKKRIRKKYNQHISILKLARFVANHIEVVLENKLNELEKYIYKYCCYETRNDRINTAQSYDICFS